MKPEPRYGYFPRWPSNDDDWIHPEDVELARQTLHTHRVFRRDGESGPFMLLHYGDVRLRVKPALWVEIEGEGIDVGDSVEVLSRMQHNEYGIAHVCEMVWDERQKAIRYTVEKHPHQPIPSAYYRADLRPINPIEPPPEA